MIMRGKKLSRLGVRVVAIVQMRRVAVGKSSGACTGREWCRHMYTI